MTLGAMQVIDWDAGYTGCVPHFPGDPVSRRSRRILLNWRRSKSIGAGTISDQ
jgi:hypothetical protein